MRGTLRMPNAMVTASKLLSGNGSASALASMNAMSCRVFATRSRPTASISALMSATVMRVPGPARSAMRKATSPVPPARSRTLKLVSPFGGLTAVTSASFQPRCRPPDIRSFIRS